MLRPTVADGDTDGFPDVEPTWSVVASGVRAVISSPGGTVLRDGSVEVVMGFRLTCDPTDLEPADRILDEQSLVTYDLNWFTQRRGMGMDHSEAEIRLVTGFAP